jgi:hypothetical protein
LSYIVTVDKLKVFYKIVNRSLIKKSQQCDTSDKKERDRERERVCVCVREREREIERELVKTTVSLEP